MCGIVGYAGMSGEMDEPTLVAMRDALSHRGPDGSGLWRSVDNRVVFGHRRLSILDLSPLGSQPMVSPDGRLTITFNGEIYNHPELREELRTHGIAFSGRSDTEVLLAAYRVWGEGCVPRLRGMFAFAIYDSERRSLFMARDRAGEKPLYWARYRRGLVFASELKALMADSSFRPRLSAEGLAFYLTYGYVPGEHCILAGVQKLMPAHCLTWSLDRETVICSRYWDIPAPKPARGDSRCSLVEELQALLTQSVSEQLVADVPVAVLLSGGVDSSVVTATAAAVSSQPVRTFTVSIPGHSDFDEGGYGRRIAQYFGTKHIELPLHASSVDLIDKLARQYDEPICDSSMIPTYLLARTVSQECKVVLGGDGGDELFGGYRAYQGALLQQRLRQLLPKPARSAISYLAETYLPGGAAKRNGLIGLGVDLQDGVAQAGTLFDATEQASLSPWLARQPLTICPKQWRRKLVEPAREMPGAVMAVDFRTYMSEDILVKVDRASMLCSLEVRAPFLDQRIVEFAYGRVPNMLRATVAERKILLKLLARRLLPRDFDVNRKQGFSIPISTWLTRAVIEKWQEECREQIEMFLSKEKVRSLVKRFNTGTHPRIFSLMILTRWMRHYNVAG